MENIKLRHKIAFHLLTASLVLNVVQGVCLDRFYKGKVQVQWADSKTQTWLPF